MGVTHWSGIQFIKLVMVSGRTNSVEFTSWHRTGQWPMGCVPKGQGWIVAVFSLPLFAVAGTGDEQTTIETFQIKPSISKSITISLHSVHSFPKNYV